MFSISIHLYSVSRRGYKAISHADLKLVWMNRAIHMVKMLGNYAKGTSHMEKSGFFVLFGVFWLLKNYSWIITWVNRRYFWGTQQVCFPYTYTHIYVCTCICMYMHKHTYVYMSIYTCTHRLTYNTEPVTSSFPPFVNVVIMCHTTSRLLKICLALKNCIQPCINQLNRFGASSHIGRVAETCTMI